MDEIGFMVSEDQADGTFHVVESVVGTYGGRATNVSPFIAMVIPYPVISGSVPTSAFDSGHKRSCHPQIGDVSLMVALQ